MSGTRLCQLLAEWAEEDRAMSEMYESISFDDVRQVMAESFPRSKVPASAGEADSQEVQQ